MSRLLFLLTSVVLTSASFCAFTNSYSNAVMAGEFLYVSGQIPIDPETGRMIQGDIEVLTNAVLDNIEHILRCKGFKMKQVVKTQVYLSDVRDYQGMDAAYASRFDFPHPPARDVVEVSNLLNNARIEISCIAHR